MNYTQLYPHLFGLEPAEAEPKPEPEQPAAANASRALTIINEGNSPEELAVLPTIGKGAGKAILDERPKDGYRGLSELPAKIFASPFNCDIVQIEAYTGE